MLEMIKKNNNIVMFAAWHDDLEGVKVIIEPNCFAENEEGNTLFGPKTIIMSKIEFVEDYGHMNPEITTRIAQKPMQEAREAIELNADTRTVYYHKQMLQRFEKALSLINA